MLSKFKLYEKNLLQVFSCNNHEFNPRYILFSCKKEDIVFYTEFNRNCKNLAKLALSNEKKISSNSNIVYHILDQNLECIDIYVQKFDKHRFVGESIVNICNVYNKALAQYFSFC